MTYMQLITKTLKFIKETGLSIIIMEDEDIPILKSNASYSLMYLTIYNLLKNDNLPKEQRDNLQGLFNYLDYILSDEGIDLGATIVKHMATSYEEVLSEPFNKDQLLTLLSSEDTTKEELDDFLTAIGEEAKTYNPGDCTVYYKAMYPIENILWDVRDALPYLFFSKEGYKYIDKEYQIEDDDLRSNLFYLLDKSITYFEDTIESHIYHEDLDEENQDVLYMSIDEDKRLNATISLVYYILELIKNKDFKKIEKLLALSDKISSVACWLNSSGDIGMCCNQEKITDFNKPISESNNNNFLKFLLDENSPINKLSIHDIAFLIIIYGKDNKIDKLVNEDWDSLINKIKIFYQEYLIKLLKNEEKQNTRYACISTRYKKLKKTLNKE